MSEENSVQTKQPSAKAVAVSNIKSLVENNYYKQLFKQSLGANAGAFTTSIMEVITNDANLIKCDPKALMQECVKAASLKLPVNKQLGYCYLVPYGTTPTLVIGYKGYIQLAIRSGQYKSVNADIVYDGELKGCDKLSGIIDLSGERESDKVIGYFAYFELLNGFKKTLYMSLDKMAKYAIRYVPTLKNKKVDELTKLAQEQSDKGVAGTGLGWLSDFNSMACKTTLRQLLGKYGYLSTEMQEAYAHEIDNEANALNQRDELNAAPKPTFDASQFAEAEEVADDEPSPFDQK